MLSYASALGQSAIALTDHGTMSGCGEGFRYADKYGIQFIAGCEHYLVPDVTIKDKFNQHIILLAMNKDGYRNLNIITTIAHSPDNFYYRPRIDLELLEKHNEGIICSTACLAGCQSKIKELKEIFGDRLYIEIHTNSLQEQRSANVQYLQLADKYDVQFYAAVDAHYTLQSQAMYQEMWQVGDYQNPPDFYLHSEEDVRRDLAYLGNDVVDLSIENTMKVASRCSFNPDYKTNHYPKSQYDSPRDEIRMRVWTGMKRKGLQKDKKHIEQVKHELEVLEKVDYFDYFIIVSDMLNHCRDNGIRTGVGRGSVVGCDIAYFMGITGIDPIKNGLIFERFAHTERVTPPDIDTDVPRGRRQDVIQYLKDSYGFVYQVATFNKMGVRACVRRACQALNISPSNTDYVADCLELEDIFDIDSAPEPEGIFLPHEYELFKKTAKQFHGKLQNFGTHASAIVVMTTDPYDFCAIERFSSAKGEQYNLNYDFHDLESMGLLKLDILGLETLDIIEDTLSMIPKEERPDIDNLPDKDGDTWLSMHHSHNAGLFQLEGNTITNVLNRVRPTDLSELTAVVALGRPAPMQTGMTDKYIARKDASLVVRSADELPADIQELLRDTHGCLIYQEQVMDIAKFVWGMSMGEADMLRRACARKDPELMKKLIEEMKQRDNLRGYPKFMIENLLNIIGKASGYLFNKSHSAAYAYTAYQTAYLKEHFPLQFYCALMNSGIDREKMLEYMREIKIKHIPIIPPNILKSDSKWSISNKKLVAGMSTIRGVGNQNFIRPTDTSSEGFKSFVGDNKRLNRQVLKNIVCAYCFDIDPKWGMDYIDWYKDAQTRKEECLERINKFQGNEKKVNEWTEKMNKISDPPNEEDYNTTLEEGRELQMEVLGYSTISPFAMYDRRLVSAHNIMVSVSKKTNTKARKNNVPMTFLEGEFQTGNSGTIMFWNPSDDVKERLSNVHKGDVVMVRCKMNGAGKLYGYDVIPAQRLA